MKNLIIGPAFPLRGGIANFNTALCKSFIDNGFESEIISFSLQYPKILFPGKTQFDNGEPPKDIKINTLINSINPLSWFKVARYIIKEKPDYVIVAFWLPFMAMSLGTILKRIRKSNIKVIAITHNIIPHDTKPGDKILTKYFINQCDAYIAMSRTVLTDLETYTKSSMKKFIPHPIYDIFGEKKDKQKALSYLKLDPNYKYILFFGLIKKYKGLDLLLTAMTLPEIKTQNIRLIVAGEFYGDKEEYINFINNNNLQNDVILTDGFVDSDDIKQYFSASDIVVQPYITATQSGVTQIAYHFDKPMLVTNVGGLAEIVPHNKVGYVVDKNPKDIADAISDFYTNNRANEFIENIKQEKKRFSWSNMVFGIEDLVNDTLK